MSQYNCKTCFTYKILDTKSTAKVYHMHYAVACRSKTKKHTSCTKYHFQYMTYI